MHTFSFHKTIPQNPDGVWALIDNFSDIWVFHPNVEHSKSLNGQRSGMGAERECSFYGGGAVKERVTAYDAAARSCTVEITDYGPFPLKHMELDFQVKAAPSGAAVLVKGRFQPKFGPMGWVMAKLMMRRQFVTLMAKVVDGMDGHLTTGRVVEKGGTFGAALAA